MSTPSVTQSRDDVRLVTPPVPRLRRRVGAAAARRRFAWALIAPAALFMLLVHGLPTVGGIYLSFKELNTFTFALLFDAPSAGVSNYSAILFDADSPLRPGFFGAVQNTAVYTVATVGGTLAGGLAVAVLLNRPIRGQKLIRTLMLTPWIVPSFVVALLWQFMWQSDVGIVNKILVDYLGILGERPVWLSGEASLWAIIIPSIWRGLPFAMLIFFAGLQAIPKELGEAAAIDGAGPWRRFRYITLPLLRPLVAIQLLFGVIYAAYQYAIPVVMLGSTPGPDADLMMTLIVRQSFQNNLFGFGAAASVLLTLAMFVWVLAWWRIFRRDLEAAR
jgi:multiple sugar transport system permease protein